MQSSDQLETQSRECDEHGTYTARLLGKLFGSPGIWSSCPECSAKRQAEEQQRQEIERQRKEQLRIERLRHESGIPLRFQAKRFAQYLSPTPAQKNALNLCQRYAAKLLGSHRGESLLLIGKPGTGKTHLATSIAYELIDAGHSARYTTASELARRVRSTYTASARESEEDVFAELNRAELLIIDEIGTTQHSEHSLRVLFELVDYRYRECRSMVLISNLNTEELKAAIGERIVDRLAEIAITIPFAWGSNRGAKAA